MTTATSLLACPVPDRRPLRVAPRTRAGWPGIACVLFAACSAAPHAAVTTGETENSGALPPMTHSGTQLTWFGQAAFKLVTPAGHVVLIDPWITNPVNPEGAADLRALDHVDLILVSHGHSDHVGDAVAIAQRTHARLVSTHDLGQSLVRYGGYPHELAGMETEGNAGGTLTLLDGEVRITFVPAVHGTEVVTPEGQPGAGEIHPAGNPGGFVIAVRGGPVIYHTGDTDVFADMARIGRNFGVTVMLACIGGHFTMDPEGAAEAVSLVHPRLVVPMHFGTFPLLAGTPAALREALTARGSHTEVREMHVHETLAL